MFSGALHVYPSQIASAMDYIANKGMIRESFPLCSYLALTRADRTLMLAPVLEPYFLLVQYLPPC